MISASARGTSEVQVERPVWRKIPTGRYAEADAPNICDCFVPHSSLYPNTTIPSFGYYEATRN